MAEAIKLLVSLDSMNIKYSDELKRIAKNGVYCASCKKKIKLEDSIEPQISHSKYINFKCPKCKINMIYDPERDKCLGW
jgi:predicted RNA-binding Zn-ribbon protein involved in translation (DUF1610 family)